MINTISKTDQLKKILLEEIKSGVFKPGDKLPSILNICQKYKVSKHTVSQALSNLNEIGVINLVHGKTTRVSDAPFKNNIEILYWGLGKAEQQEFWQEFYLGIVDEIEKNPGYTYNARRTPGERLIKEFSLHDLKDSIGVLVLGTCSPYLLELLKRYGVKFVLVYDKTNSNNIPFVSSDFTMVMPELVRLFKANNCSRIAFIGSLGENNHKEINSSKLEIFKQALVDNGLKVSEDLIISAAHDKIRTGYFAMKSLIDTDNVPDGIFLSSDSLALGVYRALHEAGLKIPEDIKIVGCDNLDVAEFLIPSLTSIELSRYEIGATAAKKLIAEIKGEKDIEKIYFTPKIIARESLNLEK